MPLRTLVELLHIAAGVMATALLVALAAWAYPLGAATIWTIGCVAMAAVAGMGVPQLKAAWLHDRGLHDRGRRVDG